MIPQNLIENALALTGKTMESMKETFDCGGDVFAEGFSYPKFFSYLLSPEFIEEYAIIYLEMGVSGFSDQEASLFRFAKAISIHQSGDSAPLISLLEKIGPN